MIKNSKKEDVKFIFLSPTQMVKSENKNERHKILNKSTSRFFRMIKNL